MACSINVVLRLHHALEPVCLKVARGPIESISATRVATSWQAVWVPRRALAGEVDCRAVHGIRARQVALHAFRREDEPRIPISGNVWVISVDDAGTPPSRTVFAPGKRAPEVAVLMRVEHPHEDSRICEVVRRPPLSEAPVEALRELLSGRTAQEGWLCAHCGLPALFPHTARVQSTRDTRGRHNKEEAITQEQEHAHGAEAEKQESGAAGGQ
mmetsp:Transcript_3222/g.9865  ORF Transcript_3222/g.9865 Transcript_3222/m.9865 type:complete len:213 (-) Transcript_3222:249-887(-)|eukprot:scaffold33308_cov31-Tisochrysis_lutea.AAC.2